MRIILIIMAIVCLGGCDKKNTSIYHNIIFKEICDIARDKYLPFCIVLIDSSQHLSQEYYSRLQNRYKFLTQQAIYNMADINVSVNEWYIKWLCPVTTPLTCVFSPEGDLVDLIPGATRETFLYSKEAINNLGPTDFHWPNYFHRNKKELIPLLNNLLEQKEILNQGVYLSSGFSELVDSLNYPYSIYLKLAGELMMHDIITSQITAKSLLEF